MKTTNKKTNRMERIKDVAHEIAVSKQHGFSDEWIKYREEEYKYWLKRIRWAIRKETVKK